MDSRVKEALDILEKEWDRQLSVPILAERVGLSLTHLRRLFKQEVGIGVKEYQKGLRLEAAVEILLKSHKKVSEVCH